MLVTDNTRAAENLGTFFKDLERRSAKPGEKIETNAINNPSGAQKICGKMDQFLHLKFK